MIGPAHHVGIAVKRLEDGVVPYRALGFEPASVEDIPSEGVRAAFLLEAASQTDANLVPEILSAVKARATLGEISDVLRAAFGTYRERQDV